jgi:signal transduction histidine kinase
MSMPGGISLKTKLALSLSLILAGALAPLGAGVIYITRQFLNEALSEKGHALADALAKTSSEGVATNNVLRDLDSLVSKAVTQEDVVYAAVLNRSGRVLASAERATAVPGPGSTATLRFSSPVEPSREMIGLSAQGDGPTGSVRLVLSAARLEKRLKEMTLWICGATLLLLGAAVFFSWIFAARLVRRLDPLLGALSSIGRGERGVIVPLECGDEIGALAQGLNSMSELLTRATDAEKAKEAELRRQEKLLRNFADELLKLHLATSSISKAADMAELYRRVCARALTLAGLDMCLLAAKAPDGCGVRLLAATGDTRAQELADDPFIAGALEDNTPRFENEMAAPDSAHAVAGYRSRMAAPLAGYGAALVLYSRTPGHFSPDNLNLYNIFASQVAAAMQKIGLIESLERKVSERTASALAAQHEAEAANRAKSAFLANMSHELRTPLNISLVSADMLERGMLGPLSDKQREYVGNISSSGKHLLVLINDILDLSKVEAGKIDFTPCNCNVRDVLKNTAAMFEDNARATGITLTTEIAPSVPETITADERKLRQIMINLLSNALKFTPRGGRVGVVSSVVEQNGLARCGGAAVPAELNPSARRYLSVSVEDSGIGIRECDMCKLFKPFSQVESSDNRAYEGTGLGLVLVKRFVELHKGAIWVKSSHGGGSAFTFALPLE